tara:strand:+ start:498 stop:1454 length:957 start_codon:yes stop_codon:yes gene_type:complete
MDAKNKITSISGDASFRKFYRKDKSILIFCKIDKKINLLNYDAINKVLIKNKLKAPKLISQHYHQNYIEVEDLGNQTIYLKLKNKNNSKIKYYKKIILLLSKLQKIKTKKIKTFINSNYIIPKYTKRKLFDESNLFIKWYIPSVIQKKSPKKIKYQFKLIIKKLLNKIKNKNNVFVHRDFHVSNLMEYKKSIALIDNQDAVYGNPAYDLASLIDDVRLKTPRSLKEKVFKEFLKHNRFINIIDFKNDFDILSVLRNIKVIGIFMRLSKRDNKHFYLKLIPYAWRLIESRISSNEIFKELRLFLDNNFSQKIRNKKWKK